MDDTEKAKLEAEAKGAATATGQAVSGTAGKLHAWFSGHPGAAVALACGLVIGFIIGYLWPK